MWYNQNWLYYIFFEENFMPVGKSHGKQILFLAVGILLSAMIAGLLFRGSISRWNSENRMGYSVAEPVNLSEVEDDQTIAGIRKDYSFPVPPKFRKEAVWPFTRFISMCGYIWTGRKSIIFCLPWARCPSKRWEATGISFRFP